MQRSRLLHRKGVRMKQWIFIVLALMVAGCAPSAPGDLPPDAAVTQPPITEPGIAETPELPSYAPKPGDVTLQRGTVFLGETQLILRESFPVQVVLGLGGELPNPCHQLRVIIEPPDSENRILVEAYTVVNPDLNCIQVIKPFQEMIELGTFPSGHYRVWVNETLIGEFD